MKCRTRVALLLAAACLLVAVFPYFSPDRVSRLHGLIRDGKTGAAIELIKHDRTLLHARKRPRTYDRTREGTPLHTAVFADNVECVRVLLELGADVHLTDYFGQSPLYVACQRQSPAVVSMLLKKGADPNRLTLSRRSPLEIAIATSRSDIIEMLLENGADIGADDFAAVEQAARAAHSDVLLVIQSHVDSMPDGNKKSRAASLLLR